MEIPLDAARFPEPYLKTRLIHPPVRSRRVPRPRLLKRLDAALDVPLTLVCAPAGYGKTTLLVDWLHTAPAPVAWVTLSPEESDVVRFLNYITLALQLIQPELGKAALAALNIPNANMLETSLHLLANDLAGLEQPAALVLDDYHWIESPAVHEALAHLVENLSPALHLVIASRVEPPLPLARLRARAAILELRATDLSFLPEETEEFINRVMDLGLSDDECRQLTQQTEGWAAALQLAGLSLQSGERPTLAAGQHYIFEYLAEEVLRRQPPALQRFLLHTSILDQLTGPLCEALVETFLPGRSGADCLEYLEHASLFTQALDSEHRWYRYHALFADFLRRHLQIVEPEAAGPLHEKAARWLAASGDLGNAYAHALAGGNPELAADLVEACAETLEKRGELDTLNRWINALPEALVLTRPRLCLGRAWGCLLQLDLNGVQRCLEQVETAVEATASARPVSISLAGEILAARALLASMRGDLEVAQACGQRALEMLPDDRHFLTGLLQFNLSLPLMITGRMRQGVAILETASIKSLQSETPFITLLCLRMLGEGYIHIGRLAQAEQTFKQLATLIEKEWGRNSPLMGTANMGLGEIHRQRNQFDLAEPMLLKSIVQCLLWMPAIALDSFIWLVNLYLARGDFAAARATIQRARQASEGRGYSLIDDWWMLIVTIRLDVLQGHTDDVMRWVRDNRLDLDHPTNLNEFFAQSPGYLRELACCLLARIYLMLGRRENRPLALENARTVLAYVRLLSEQSGVFNTLIEGLLLSAQVEHALGNPAAAQEALHRALDLAAPERPIRVFLDEGEPLKTLLEARRPMDLSPSERAYLEEILAQWQLEAPTTLQPTQQTMPTPLSFRELEVLRWIADGKSNQEIAAGLVLSLNTVKRHVSTIMDKLGARNRTEAVMLAQQAGLLV